jgi:uncharacterized glyoxalase superfamily protein PhnB
MRLLLLFTLTFSAFANVYIKAYEYADDELRMFGSDAQAFAQRVMQHRQPEKLLDGHQTLFRFADSSSGYSMFRSEAIEEANRLFSMRRPNIKAQCAISGFQYGRSDLRMFKDDAIEFARKVMQPIRCEYTIDFHKRAFNFAYNTVDMMRSDSQEFADKFLTHNFPREAVDVAIASYDFCYNIVDLMRSDSFEDMQKIVFSRRPAHTWDRYQEMYKFASSSRGLNYSRRRAHEYVMGNL